MAQPASVVNDGNHLLLWVSAIADPAAPTVAELNAGLDLTCYLTDSGWTPGMSEERVPDNRICTNQNYSLPGRLTFAPNISYVSSPAVSADDEARTTLTSGSEGHLVWRPLVDYTTAVAANDKVNVYPVQLGEQEFADPTMNTPGTVVQQLHLRPPGRQYMVSVAA